MGPLHEGLSTPSFLAQCLFALAKFIRVPSLFVNEESDGDAERSDEMRKTVSQLHAWLEQLPEPLFTEQNESVMESQMGAAPELGPSQDVVMCILQQNVAQVCPTSYSILRPLLLFLQQYVLRQQDYARQLQLLAIWLAPLLFPALCYRSVKRGRLLATVFISQAKKIFEAASVPATEPKKDSQQQDVKPQHDASLPAATVPPRTLHAPAAARQTFAAVASRPSLPTVFARAAAVYIEPSPQRFREHELQHQDTCEFDADFLAMLDGLVDETVTTALFSEEGDMSSHSPVFSIASARSPAFNAAGSACPGMFAEVRTQRQLVTAAGGGTHMPRSPMRPAPHELRRSQSAPPAPHSPPSANSTPRAGIHWPQPSQQPAVPVYGQVMTAAQVAARMLSRRSDSGVSRGGADITFFSALRGSPAPASPPPMLPNPSDTSGCLSPALSVITPASLGLRPINTRLQCWEAADSASSPGSANARDATISTLAATGLTA